MPEISRNRLLAAENAGFARWAVYPGKPVAALLRQSDRPSGTPAARRGLAKRLFPAGARFRVARIVRVRVASSAGTRYSTSSRIVRRPRGLDDLRRSPGCFSHAVLRRFDTHNAAQHCCECASPDYPPAGPFFCSILNGWESLTCAILARGVSARNPVRLFSVSTNPAVRVNVGSEDCLPDFRKAE